MYYIYKNNSELQVKGAGNQSRQSFMNQDTPSTIGAEWSLFLG